MWTAKLILPSDQTHLLASRTKKYNINLTGYPISHSIIKKRLFVTIAGIISGSSENKKNFIKSIIKDKRVLKIEQNNDFLITQIEQPSEVHVLYDPSIFHIKPILVDNNGFYHWTIASWTKDKLIDVATMVHKYNGKVKSIKQQKLHNITFTSILPALTDKQQRALELAIENGYYNSPRKITLKQLAKLMRISYSTYQFHLCVAEKKIIPSLYKKV